MCMQHSTCQDPSRALVQDESASVGSRGLDPGRAGPPASSSSQRAASRRPVATISSPQDLNAGSSSGTVSDGQMFGLQGVGAAPGEAGV